MELRRAHPRAQGDLGEAAAIQWLTEIGAGVCFPLFHSPDYDLVAELPGGLARIQVKTSTRERPGGRYQVQVATRGGNQTWSGIAKRLDPSRFDYLFILVGDGRRWFIPASEIVATTSLNLGGKRYGEFQVLGGESEADLSNIARPARGSAGAGEPGQTVNLVPRAEWVRIPPPPSDPSAEENSLPAHTVGRTRISANHQLTIPSGPFATAELEVGDEIRVEATKAGCVSLQRLSDWVDQQTAQLRFEAPDE